MHRATRPTRAAAACAALLVAMSLSACGGKSLTDGDKKVCDAAARDDADDVYDVTSLAKDPDISKQAQRIRFGSSDWSNEDAMKQILSACKSAGYTPKGSGR